jgi:hypothetical protein
MPAPRRLLPLLPLLLAGPAGCGPKIGMEYERERALALALPPPVEAQWRPDLRILVSEPPIERAIHRALDAGLEGLDKKLQADALGGRVSLRPKARVDAVTVKIPKDCAGCVAVTAELKGELGWSLGPLSGQLPFRAGLGGRPRFALDQVPTGWQVALQLTGIDRVAVQIAALQELDLGPLLQGWVSQGVAAAPPVALGEIGAEGLPLRAMRLGQAEGALVLEALSDVPSPGQVGGDGARLSPGADWSVRVAQDTLLSMARREAFKAGPQQLDLALDPRGLRVDGGAWALDLRLWRLGGLGWWREYTVNGEIAVQDGQITLTGTGADEGAASPGAGLANPLLALTDGLLLEILARAISETLPAATRAQAGGFVLDAAATTARGQAGDLVIDGRFALERAAP